MGTDTKTALLDTAELAARTRGFDGFSYADLSEAVGIRKASIHYHFPTKAALSSALFERYHAELESRCSEIEQRNETAAGRLLDLIALYREALDGGNMVCLCVSLISSRESLSDEVLGQIVAFRKMMARWIAAVFALGKDDGSIIGVRDPNAEALATLATLEGAHLAARAETDITVFDSVVAVLRARCT